MEFAIVVGDMHVKQKWILPYIDRVIDNFDSTINHILFLGDYVDDWGVSDEDILNALGIQIDWVNNKKESGFDIICLCGNHDFSYLKAEQGKDYYCSGHRNSIHGMVKRKLERLDPCMACNITDKVIATHAGITREWFDSLSDNHFFLDNDSSAESLATMISCMNNEQDDHFLFDCGISRGGWTHPGPLWADRRELLAEENPMKVVQIVGHTPIETLSIAENGESRICFCDTFSTRGYGEAIGDGSIMIIGWDSDTGDVVFSTTRPELEGLPHWDEICMNCIEMNIPLDEYVPMTEEEYKQWKLDSSNDL